MSWEDYDGSVLAYNDRQMAVDTIKAHLVEYFRENIGTFKLNLYAETDVITYWGDYPIAENMVLPSAIITIQKEIQVNKFVGNYMFSYTNTASGVAASGSHEDVYGSRFEYLIRADVWSTTPTERDVIAGLMDNLLRYATSPQSNDLFNKGMRNIRVIGSELIGYDQTDRYIKDVSYHVGVDTVYRKNLMFIVTSDVRIVPPTPPDVRLVGEINWELYLASGVGGVAGYDTLITSGTVASGS